MKGTIRKLLKEEVVRRNLHMVLPDSVLTMNDIFKDHGHKLYIVGGAVRDTLLGIEPKDFDLVLKIKQEFQK